MEPIAKETQVQAAFADLLEQLKALKPNDRSDIDRYWAITITEVEKAAAIFATYAVPNKQ